mmetsp:Transcript_12738/g.29086  ORF Transcript_12738/g.29086 Transcript_12738/m.29086 type:complete len:220 (-) Transcript_12738:533-1192(-)
MSSPHLSCGTLSLTHSPARFASYSARVRPSCPRSVSSSSAAGGGSGTSSKSNGPTSRTPGSTRLTMSAQGVYFPRSGALYSSMIRRLSLESDPTLSPSSSSSFFAFPFSVLSFPSDAVLPTSFLSFPSAAFLPSSFLSFPSADVSPSSFSLFPSATSSSPSFLSPSPSFSSPSPFVLSPSPSLPSSDVLLARSRRRLAMAFGALGLISCDRPTIMSSPS